jgi:hypothetical protein
MDNVLSAMDNVLSAIPGAARTLPTARGAGDGGKKRIELSRGLPPQAMGIAWWLPPSGGRGRGGQAVCGDAAAEIGKRDATLAAPNRRISKVWSTSVVV